MTVRIRGDRTLWRRRGGASRKVRSARHQCEQQQGARGAHAREASDVGARSHLRRGHLGERDAQHAGLLPIC